MGVSTIVITLTDEGELKLDSRGVDSDEQGIMKILKSLSETVGDGEVKVEKHVHGLHTHVHKPGGIKSG